MKAINFISEWDKTHTSQPSYQDVIDWVEKQYKIDTQKNENINLIKILDGCPFGTITIIYNRL